MSKLKNNRDVINWYQYQTSDGKNLRLTNLGLVQTSDWYKRRTRTNVGIVQTSDGTNVRPVQMPD